MEAVAQNRAGCNEVVCGLCSTGGEWQGTSQVKTGCRKGAVHAFANSERLLPFTLQCCWKN